MSHPFLDGRLSLCTSHSLTSVLDVLNDYFLSNHILIYLFYCSKYVRIYCSFLFFYYEKNRISKKLGRCKKNKTETVQRDIRQHPCFKLNTLLIKDGHIFLDLCESFFTKSFLHLFTKVFLSRIRSRID